MILPRSPARIHIRQVLLRVAVLLPLLHSIFVAPASAQRCFDVSFDPEASYPCRFEAPRWSGELASLGANAALGALTAGLVRELRGGSFSDGFVKGALGGVITYAGKRVAAERFDGAGLLGRQIAAVGSSATRNAGADVPLFQRLTLPFGPVWLEVQRESGTRLSARVDPVALGWIVHGVLEEDLDFEVGESLSSGAAIFRTNEKLLLFDTDTVAGTANAGVVFVAGIEAFGERRRDRTAAHERIHILQQDQFAILWTVPLGEWAMRKSSFFAPIAPRIALNVSTEIMRLLAPLFDSHEDRPWELEAIFHAR